MVASFILTRTFVISALCVSAFSVAYAAPVASPEGEVNVTDVLEGCFCRQMGCLFVEPTHSAVPTISAEPTATSVIDDGTPRTTSVPELGVGSDEKEAVFDIDESQSGEHA
ncbi:hypothetical protein BD413DRAFT_611819 [Trametes elegans]|nr:hypothetical protein BD413DRAFT_611819 [Trametes elegans]